MSLPPEIVALWAHFALLFSQRVAAHAQVLVIGALLAQGPRTVTAALGIMGQSQETHFTNYHRVLNRAAWSTCWPSAWGTSISRPAASGASTWIDSRKSVVALPSPWSSTVARGSPPNTCAAAKLTPISCD